VASPLSSRWIPCDRAPARAARSRLCPADPFFCRRRSFDALPDVVFFVNEVRAGVRVWCQRDTARRCGARSKAELLGKNRRGGFPTASGASYAAQDRQVLAGRAIRDRLELHLYPRPLARCA
jgi:hypothetical protein